jgi:predicted nuclease of predicted toxin-antitoxin system
MKILLDMNLSPRWRTLFEREHISAVHWSEVGPVGAPDTEILAYAAQHDYVVLTQDLDFSAILAATSGIKPSVVQLRSDKLDPDVIGPKVISALRQLESELNSGALLSIDPERTRVRILPLLPKSSA